MPGNNTVAVDLFDLTSTGIAPITGETCETAFAAAQYSAVIVWKIGGVTFSGDTFAPSTVYTAVITLTAADGFTFNGLAANQFTYSGIESGSVTNPAGSGNSLVVTIIFPETSAAPPVKVTVFTLDSYVTAPVRGAVPNAAAITTEQFTGTVAWKTANGGNIADYFAAETVYKTEITLSVKSGYTFTGIVANSFTYSDATSVAHAAGSGSSLALTITFPSTGAGDKITVTSTEDLPGLSELLSGKNGGNSAADPINLAVELELTEANWNGILSAIDSANRYVSLDLAACTRSGSNSGGGLRSNGDFSPAYSLDNRSIKIIGLTLPLQAAGIVSGTSGSPLFRNFTALKTVTGAGVTSIGDYAFSGCSALASVSAPAVTGIGSYAFYDCSALTSVDLPATSIGSYVFSGCSALTSVNLPAVTSIGSSAFSGCSALSSVSAPAVTSIGSSAFSGCSALTSVSALAVTSIGSSAFSSCFALTSISFQALTSIGDYAFSGCSALTSVSLPAVTSIGSSVFSSCSALTSVSALAVTSIGSYAFSDCSALTSVSLPAVTNIGDYAFLRSGALTSVTISASLAETSFNNAYFGGKIVWTLTGSGGGCTVRENGALLIYGNKLVYGRAASGSITLPDSITRISDGAFSGGTALTSVSAPEVTSIGRDAFSGCSALTSASLPAVTNIGGGAFSNCSALSAVTLGAAPPILGRFIFSGVTAVRAVTISIPSGAQTAYGVSSYNNSDSDALNWGNGFRGMGWDGTSYLNARGVNANVTLDFSY